MHIISKHALNAATFRFRGSLWSLIVGCLTLLSIVASGCSNSAPNQVTPPTISVSVSPNSISVQIGQTQSFTARVANDSQLQGVTWSLSCTGTVSCGALTPSNTANPVTYTAPPSVPGSAVTLTATANADRTKSNNATITISTTAPSSVSVLTWHNDIQRSGVNSQETTLSTTNVRTATFGKLFSCPVDADVYAQPLYVPGVTITGKGAHNVVFVATEKNSLYAVDADAAPCSVLWQKSLMNSGETFVTESDVGCSEAISPNIGITGTPVIDAASQTLYVVSTSRSSTAFIQRIHAVTLADGTEKFGGPTLIQASISGTGADSSGGTISFRPQSHLQRPGLLLLGGAVYVAWASYCDNDPYHGWVLSFSAGSGTLQRVSTFNDTPNGTRGGIWMSGAAPASDGNSIFLITGNGTFDANGATAPNTDFGDTFLKLTGALSVSDWFTPSNQSFLDANDLDVGGGGAVLLIDNPGGPFAHLLIGGGKEGKLYLLNRDNLGHIAANDAQIVQSFSLSQGIFATPVFRQNTLYIAAAGSPLSAFSFIASTGKFNTVPTSQSSATFGFPGATPSLSSNGTTNGIVWAIERSATGAAVLHAYDATNVANELWNSSMAAGSRDQAGGAVKFTVPTIANGKVYIGAQGELDVYGLLP